MKTSGNGMGAREVPMKTSSNESAAIARSFQEALGISSLLLLLTACTQASTAAAPVAGKAKAPAKMSKLPAKPASKSEAKVPSVITNPETIKAIQESKKITDLFKQPLKPGSKLFMWKAKSDSGATVYLLGTIHVFKKDFYPLPAEIEKALNKSKALLLEVELSDDSDDDKDSDEKKKESRENLLHNYKYFLPKGDNLTNHISSNTYALLQKYCALNDIPVRRWLRMRAWFASFVLTYAEMGSGGYLQKLGIDNHLSEEAKKQGKKVMGLESKEFHEDVTAGLSDELQNKMLKRSLLDYIKKLQPDNKKNEQEKKKEEIPNAFICWRNGDSDNMLKSVSKEVEEHPDQAPIEKRILYDRNDTMTDAILPYLKGSDTFMVAVGSAHMVGDNGIVEALRKKGFKVTQVCVGDEI